jgi:L-threonylcarbamoyladenylate synthase
VSEQHPADPVGEPVGEPDESEGRDDATPAYARFDVTGEDGRTAAIEAARKAVAAGERVVLPTDTVYGIGADAFSAEAVQGLLDAKGRGRDMPPPVLIGDASLLRALATDVPDQANALVEAHWPGPLTIICRIQPSLRMDLGDTDGTIALRVPDHELAREVLRRTGPLAVSSANRSGQPAALTCDEAVDQLGDRVAVYLDGGPAGTEVDGVRTSPPSTIVDFTRSDDGQVLRAGALAIGTLRATLPGIADLHEPEPEPEPEEEEEEELEADEPEELTWGPAEPDEAVAENQGASHGTDHDTDTDTDVDTHHDADHEPEPPPGPTEPATPAKPTET